MRKNCKIPDSVIRRIPKYIRYVNRCLDENVHYATSADVADSLRISPGTVRNDLNFFGLFGNQGKGYETWKLKGELERIMGINQRRRAVVIGREGLGKAIIEQYRFEEIGFAIDAQFSTDKEHGDTVVEIPEYDMNQLDSYLKSNTVDVYIIAVADEVAQETAEYVISRGAKAILNCTGTDIQADDSIFVENLQPVDSMLRISYFMAQM